ncbi:hypothetical protein Tco_0058554 [Tanacetum coccineum]
MWDQSPIPAFRQLTFSQPFSSLHRCGISHILNWQNINSNVRGGLEQWTPIESEPWLTKHRPVVYGGGEARISALRKLFPFMDDKKSLASDKERLEVEGKASLLAAVGYYVSMHTDIFIIMSICTMQ